MRFIGWAVVLGLAGTACAPPGGLVTVAPESTAPDAAVPAPLVLDAGWDDDVVDAGANEAFDGGLPADAGHHADAGSDPLRLDVPPLAWAFVALPQTRCANGSSTGVAVNWSPTSDELLVYFVGGGACWNLATCGLGTSANVRRGYGAQDFAADGLRGWAMFDRQEARNPFRAMSHVVVPYCTADVHAGTRVTTYDGLVTIHHAGARNVDALVPHLAATFGAVRRVVLVGSSAGGFGAQLNAPKFAAAFPASELVVLADSAQLVNPAGGLVSQWVSAWGVSVPPACQGCATDFPRYLDFLLTSSPGVRVGLLASTRDATLTPFFNYGVDVQAFDLATRQLLDRYDRSANGSYFARGGVRHTWLEFVTRVSGADDVATFDWVTAFLAGAVDRRRP
jgi:hypothetical protein